MVAKTWKRKYADSWLFLTRTLQDGDFRSALTKWMRHLKHWLISSNVLLKHWTYFPKDMLINSKTRYLLHFFYDLVSAFDKFQWMLRYLLLKIIFFALIFKSSIFLKSFFMYIFLWFLFYSINLICHFNYVLTKFKNVCLFKLDSCFKFFKSCIAPCNAVNSGCLLKGLKTFSSWFVYIYTHLLATQWTRNLNNEQAKTNHLLPVINP